MVVPLTAALQFLDGTQPSSNPTDVFACILEPDLTMRLLVNSGSNKTIYSD